MWIGSFPKGFGKLNTSWDEGGHCGCLNTKAGGSLGLFESMRLTSTCVSSCVILAGRCVVCKQHLCCHIASNHRWFLLLFRTGGESVTTCRVTSLLGWHGPKVYSFTHFNSFKHPPWLAYISTVYQWYTCHSNYAYKYKEWCQGQRKQVFDMHYCTVHVYDHVSGTSADIIRTFFGGPFISQTLKQFIC